MFAVEEKGLEKDSDIEEKNLMQQFIDYIKVGKLKGVGYRSIYFFFQ